MAELPPGLRTAVTGLPYPMASARPYNPTLRDRAAGGLLGMGMPRGSVKGLLGSTGLGPEGMGLVDTPALAGGLLGVPFAVDEAARTAGTPEGTLNAMALVPGGKAAGQVSREVVDQYVRAFREAHTNPDAFWPLFKRLEADPAVRQPEAAAIASEFAFETAPSTAKKEALRRISRRQEVFDSASQRFGPREPATPTAPAAPAPQAATEPEKKGGGLFGAGFFGNLFGG